MLPINPNDKEYPAKCEEYMHYIDEHRERVKTAYFKLFKDKLYEIIEADGLPGSKDGSYVMKLLEDSIERHDLSKYEDAEFYGYRAKFYPTSLEIEMKNDDPEFAELLDEEFKLAWLHHQQCNTHHPHYFMWYDHDDNDLLVLRDTIKEKPDTEIIITFLIEMLCDWAAMSKGKDDYNYLSWLCSDKSSTERHMLVETNKKQIEIISSIIYPNYKEYESALKIALYGEDNTTKEE